jgi:hypothetical protein
VKESENLSMYNQSPIGNMKSKTSYRRLTMV